MADFGVWIFWKMNALEVERARQRGKRKGGNIEISPAILKEIPVPKAKAHKRRAAGRDGDSALMAEKNPRHGQTRRHS